MWWSKWEKKRTQRIKEWEKDREIVVRWSYLCRASVENKKKIIYLDVSEYGHVSIRSWFWNTNIMGLSIAPKIPVITKQYIYHGRCSKVLWMYMWSHVWFIWATASEPKWHTPKTLYIRGMTCSNFFLHLFIPGWLLEKRISNNNQGKVVVMCLIKIRITTIMKALISV